MKRLLIGQLGANGDCLYGTILARQLRRDHPTAHITWAISSQCSQVLRNNPHVDAIWEIPVGDWAHQELMWRVFEREAHRRVSRHDFDHAYLSQIWPNNFQNFDGTVRPSILRSYGKPITVPVENVIELDEQELARVSDFVVRNDVLSYEHRILFECSSKSGQSFITPELAQRVAEFVYRDLPSATILLSTHLPIVLQHPRSRNAGALTLRETAGLTHSCSLFVGAGSGGTVAATSTAAAKLPMIQLLAADTSVYASFAHDFEYYCLPNDHILEMTNESPRAIARAIVSACRDGMPIAKAKHEDKIPLHFQNYKRLIEHNLLQRARFIDAALSLLTTIRRYGWCEELVTFGFRQVAPRLVEDPDWIYEHRRREARSFLEQMHQQKLEMSAVSRPS